MSKKNNKSTYSDFMRYLNDLNAKSVQKIHASVCIIFGVLLFLLPSSVFSTIASGYDHMAHEFMRLYGIINVAVGWLVYRLGPVTDGRIRYKHNII